MRVDQFHPSFNYGDAIGENLINLKKCLVDMGYQSDIFALNIDKRFNEQGKNYKDLNKISTSEDILLVHYSIWNEVYTEVLQLPCKKVLIYHNITPPNFFTGYNSVLEEFAKTGLEKLVEIKDEFIFALADSEFNKEDLLNLGYQGVEVLPITKDFTLYSDDNVKINENYIDGKINILFVGRIAPNKKQEDIIKSFFYYHKINPNSRLILTGLWNGFELYKKKLDALINHLDLVENVIFTGHIRTEELLGLYRTSQVFLCMSEHEGFCVPLLEAMYFEVPIIAYKSSAIPYTLGDSGLVIDTKDYASIAELINLVVSNESISEKLIDKQNERYKFFSNENLASYLTPYIEKARTIIVEPKPKVIKESLAIVTSDAMCGIHEYSKNLLEGFIQNGYDASLVGVKNRNKNDLMQKISLLRDYKYVIFEHEEAIFDAKHLVKAISFLKKHGVKIILSPHELEISKFSDYRKINNIFNIQHSKSALRNFLRYIKRVIKILYYFTRLWRNLDYLGRLPDKIVIHSKKQEEHINIINYINADKIQLVPLPAMNLEGNRNQLRNKLGLPLDKFIFIIPGFIFRRKRIIEVIRNLPHNSLLVISGTESEFDPGYLQEINKYIQNNKIVNVVINTDYDLLELYVKASDSVVLYYQDIFQSAAATLAIGAEKPCIFSDIPGFQTFEGAGIFVNNENELKQGMLQILDKSTYALLLNNVLRLKEQLQPSNIAISYLENI
ncbi:MULTISPECIES: glycosyltransferase [unclassified Paenibacillus]|uniref:glycosyltransferase family 4 protein n=1 Tax=unclassified Paenibacillus TaxID=185978 RepID=UPI001AE1CB54|nr:MULTISPECIES: glycosyltransferase [unclassified Paenibacillus]MBP1157468.1 glycosyltransferase involved in cell wall biosynthesis [Paenibacillus sp. PvP091]MBP1171795.1 glycosyltransferase involved in cell wall biosynthesis [Paenibacillus sp. PvR098]MBP2438176.1 glycosyltransferase involved in cell wall biosynthesis [Paenibacillus sp. PvP052]